MASMARQVGIEVNIAKTEYMALNVPDGHQHVSVHGQELARVSNFKYLGSRMESSDADLSYRTGQAWSAFWKLRGIWQAP